MIFIAVMMGFFAESYREDLGDRHKEKEYMTAMVGDLRADTANLDRVISDYASQKIHEDTLLNYLFKNKEGFNLAYYRNSWYINGYTDFTHADYTVQQLKSSEGMRLIQSRAAVRGILAYEDAVKRALINEHGLSDLQYSIYLFNADIFNYKAIEDERKKGKNTADMEKERLKILLTDDDKELNKYYNKIRVYVILSAGVRQSMEDTRREAIKLMHTLQKEYHLKDE